MNKVKHKRATNPVATAIAANTPVESGDKDWVSSVVMQEPNVPKEIPKNVSEIAGPVPRSAVTSSSVT